MPLVMAMMPMIASWSSIIRPPAELCGSRTRAGWSDPPVAIVRPDRAQARPCTSSEKNNRDAHHSFETFSWPRAGVGSTGSTAPGACRASPSCGRPERHPCIKSKRSSVWPLSASPLTFGRRRKRSGGFPVRRWGALPRPIEHALHLRRLPRPGASGRRDAPPGQLGGDRPQGGGPARLDRRDHRPEVGDTPLGSLPPHPRTGWRASPTPSRSTGR
jgi:hypothetical protein